METKGCSRVIYSDHVLMQRWACGVANGTGSAAFTNDVVAERITNKLTNLEQIYTDSVSPVDVSVFSLVTL